MLNDHKNKKVNQLSGGMKRKLSLGMALVTDPRTLILDEPTSGLDVESRRNIWDLILRIRKDRSIILSTQHIEEADVLANRVCILSHGRIVALDTPDNIKKHFGVGYNLILEHKQEEGKNNGLTDTREELRDLFASGRFVSKKTVESIDSTDERVLFQIPIIDVRKMPALLAHLEDTYPTLHIDIELNSLEDSYIKIAEDEVDYHKKIKQQEHDNDARLRGDVDLEIYDNLTSEQRLRRGTAIQRVDTMLDNYKRVEGSPTFWF